ncbi:MAG: NAD(P)/FAD-dependent oxidoreductase [Acidimicrobiales bacterium]
MAAEPRDAEVTVVGGGAIGCAVAYHLARHGRRDVQLLEAGELAGATTSQAAGMAGQARTSVARSRLAMASVRRYREIEEETGCPVDWRRTGSLRIALSSAAEAELSQIASVAAVTGLPVEIVRSRRVPELFPPITRIEEIRCALWSPEDGYLQPNSLTAAYVSGARRLGVDFVTGCPVTGIAVRSGTVEAIRTPLGEVRTDLVIDAAGPWAGPVARLVGVELPIVPVRHSYFITEPTDGWHGDLPNIRVPDLQVYMRAEVNAALCGGFERAATSLDPRELGLTTAVPDTYDWDVLADFAANLGRLVPSIPELGVRAVFHGWPAFSPDGRFIVGPVDGVHGFAMAAACNAHGVTGSAALAEHLIEALDGQPSDYVASLSPSRFQRVSWSWERARRDAQAVYENYYPLPQVA